MAPSLATNISKTIEHAAGHGQQPDTEPIPAEPESKLAVLCVTCCVDEAVFPGVTMLLPRPEKDCKSVLPSL